MQKNNSSGFPVFVVAGVVVVLAGMYVLTSQSVKNFMVSTVDDDSPSDTELQSIEIKPSKASLTQGEQQKFEAFGEFPTGEVRLRVQWKLDPSSLGKLECGKYSSNCLFTAGTPPKEGKVKINYGDFKDEAKVSVTGEPVVLFSDVTALDWFYEAVTNAVNRNIMTGKSDGKFYPGESSLRADTVLSTYRLIELQKVSLPDDTNCGTFSDVPSNHYAAASVCAFAGKGWVQGVGEGVFGVSEPVTREQAAKMIWVSLQDKLKKLPKNSVEDYQDVPKDRWSYQYVMELSGRGIFSGKEKGKFDPEGHINRAELSTVMVRVDDVL